MSAKRKASDIQRLMAAMDRCALARGEAQWTHGYRTGKGDNCKDGDRLYEKEIAQWKQVGAAEKAFRRLALRVLRAASERAS